MLVLFVRDKWLRSLLFEQVKLLVNKLDALLFENLSDFADLFVSPLGSSAFLVLIPEDDFLHLWESTSKATSEFLDEFEEFV